MSRPLISFDAAGTLIQVRQPVGRTYAEFARRHGIHVNEPDLKKCFSKAWGRVPSKVWPEGECAPDDDRSWWHALVAEVFSDALGHPLPEAVLDPLFDELYLHFAKPETWMVYDDVLPVLENLSRDHQLCVLSNFDRRLRSILDGHGLTPFFGPVILSSEVGASKPHSRMFNRALRLTGADASTSWHVGDDDRCDIQGATEGGWKAFAVSRPERGLLQFVEKVRSEGNSNLHTPS